MIRIVLFLVTLFPFVGFAQRVDSTLYLENEYGVDFYVDTLEDGFLLLVMSYDKESEQAIREWTDELAVQLKTDTVVFKSGYVAVQASCCVVFHEKRKKGLFRSRSYGNRKSDKALRKFERNFKGNSAVNFTWVPYDEYRALVESLSPSQCNVPYLYVIRKGGFVSYELSGKYSASKMEKLLDELYPN